MAEHNPIEHRHIQCPTTLFLEQKHPAFAKLFREYWYDKAKDEPKLTEEYIPEEYEADFQEYLSNRSGKGRYKYLFITVNPKPEVNFEDFYAKVVKYLNKVWIDYSMSTIEWRENDTGMHLHSKVWLSGSKVPYRCKAEVYNTFKSLVGSIRHVNVQYANREGCFEDYIRGISAGEVKPNHANDVKLRSHYGISEILEDDLFNSNSEEKFDKILMNEM